jgi:hypothetical protein
MQLKRDYFKKYSEPSKQAKVKPPPTVKPDPAIVTQFKNDEGKQVKIANGIAKVKGNDKDDKPAILKTKQEIADEKEKYLPGQRFLKKLKKTQPKKAPKKIQFVDDDDEEGYLSF